MTKAAQLATVGGFAQGPAFSAYLSGNQSVSGSTWTRVQFNTESYDTNNNFDSSTNYRFTPTVPGYYQINWTLSYGAGTATAVASALYKNGVIAKAAVTITSSSNVLDDWSSSGACVIYMNGSTDYLDVYGYIVGTTNAIQGTAPYSWFDGTLVRAA